MSLAQWAPALPTTAPWLLIMDTHGGPAVLLSPWEKGTVLEPWQAEEAQRMRLRAAQLAGKLPAPAAWIRAAHPCRVRVSLLFSSGGSIRPGQSGEKVRDKPLRS